MNVSLIKVVKRRLKNVSFNIFKFFSYGKGI